VVTTSTDIMGGPVSNAVYFGTQKFHDANPGVVKTFLAAAAEADAFIKDHPKEACAMYLAATCEKGTAEELVDIISKPDMFYTLNPVGTLATAQHMADTKVMKVRPASWKEFFFADISGIEGN
jgi:NitT/TauT family transport system substrate-binding protein